jgi:16S rRNA (uracil1498-N3)-methyltransferase
MSAPLFLVAPGTLDQVGPGDDVDLSGAEARHAVQVRRIGVGERVDLADGAGVRVEGVVRAVVGPGSGPGAGSGAGSCAGSRSGAGSAAPAAALVLEVTRRLDDPLPDLRLVLVQALAKGDRDVTAVETATELGVDEIVPWQAERSVVVWRGERATKSQGRWVATAQAAAKQSRRSRVPHVGAVLDTAALVDRIAASGFALVLHEEAERPLVGVELPVSGDLLIVVGPEGGISPAELARLCAAGALPVRLGPTVLRSSSAGPAAIAVLSAQSRWR